MENNYEQKYKKALDNARLMYDAGNNDVKHIVGQLFPELKESEDEKVRKKLINLVKKSYEQGGYALHKWEADEMLTWLEKQGEKHPDPYNGISFEYNGHIWGMCARDNGVDISCDKHLIKHLEEQGEKLPVGFYYVNSEGKKFYSDTLKYGNITLHVEKQGEQRFADTDNKFIRMRETKPKDISEFLDRLTTVEQEFLWEHIAKIRELDKEEQKPADKVEPKFHEGDWVIFNEHHNSVYQVEKIQGLRYYLRHYLGGTLSVHFDNELIRLWTLQDAKSGDVLACNEEILLFKSYSAQGRISLYCWHNGQTNNFHSKEVVDTLLATRNKIYPATKEQRDTLLKAMADAGYTFDFEKKELKKITQKSEENKGNIGGISANWSEEDKDFMYDTLSNLTELKDRYGEGYGNVGKCIDWLKSLRPQNHWKPSDEQMMALLYYCSNGSVLTSLYNDLKKLKEE